MAKRKPLTDEERVERRERDRERLQEATEALQSSEGWKRWIAVRRHNGLGRYSANNQFLLVCEAWARQIELSYVAGYRWWADNGYQGRRGEKALWVLAPIVRKVEDETTGEKVRRVVGFRNAPVFDRSQVDAGPEALAIEPPAIEPLTGSSHGELLPSLHEFAESIGVRVSFQESMGSVSARGFYDHSRKLIGVAPDHPNAMVRTLLHELAHALFAGPQERKRTYPAGFDYAEEECIVECAGYIAAAGAGLDTSGEAVSYCAGWGESGKLEVVSAAATLIDELAAKLEGAIAPQQPDEAAEQANITRQEVAG